MTTEEVNERLLIAIGKIENQIGGLRNDLQSQISALRQDFGALRTDLQSQVSTLRQDIGGMRTDLHQQVNQLQIDFQEQFNTLRNDFRNKWWVPVLITVIGTLVSLAGAITTALLIKK